MSYLYNFGLSQEDERSEARALDLRPADRVLSIVSAGRCRCRFGGGARRDLGGALRAVSVQDHPVCHPAAGPQAHQGNPRVPHPGRAGGVLRLQAGPASDPAAGRRTTASPRCRSVPSWRPCPAARCSQNEPISGWNTPHQPALRVRDRGCGSVMVIVFVRHDSHGNLLPPIPCTLLAGFAARAVRHDLTDRSKVTAGSHSACAAAVSGRVRGRARGVPTGWRQDRTTVSGHTA